MPLSHEQSAGKLNLDEALVSVVYRSASLNSSSSGSGKLGPIDVYYRLIECFGCPLELLKKLEFGRDEQFVVQTKYDLQLELRQAGNGKASVCKFNQLSLNNQGLYQINIIDDFPSQNFINSSEQFENQHTSATTQTNTYECTWQVLDDGQCLVCPLAMLLFFLILITFAESLFDFSLFGNFCLFKKSKTRNEPAITPTGDRLDSSEQSVEVGVESAGSSAQDEPKKKIQAPLDGSSSVNSTRVESLDAFRGLTIAGMIMVNYGGAGLTQLEHKAWDGLTCADLVFPFFIFSMGASVAISTRRLFVNGCSLGTIYGKIIRRSLMLMFLGLSLNSKWLMGRSLYNLRLTGVLQRFSISYLIVASMYTIELFSLRWIKSRNFYRSHLVARSVAIAIELFTALVHLTVYLYFTFYFDYNDTCPPGYMGPGGQTGNSMYVNCTGGAAAWLDRQLLGERHLYHDLELAQLFKTPVTHDPEGLLGFTTSVLLTLMGLQFGKTLIRNKQHKQRLLTFGAWILVLAIASSSALVIPINKKLWSFTFVTVTGCLAFVTLTILYLLMDVRQCKRTFLLKLLVAAGKNSIFLYVGHSLLSGMLPWWFKVPDESSHLQLLARLTWSTFVWLLIAQYMAVRKLFIKI